MPKTEEKRLDIVFRGIDYWSRPVFYCKWNKCYYGSTNKLFPEGAKEDDVLKELDENDICFFGDSFDCEPMGSNPKYPVRFTKIGWYAYQNGKKVRNDFFHSEEQAISWAIEFNKHFTGKIELVEVKIYRQ